MKTNQEKREEMENRLIRYGVKIMNLCETLKNSFSGKHLSLQLLRSSSSAALNYGEAQGAESRRDFIHKMNIIIKELRESLINIKMIGQSNLKVDQYLISELEDESNQLISIFVKSVETAKKNMGRKDKR